MANVARVVSAAFALSGFSVALVSGVAAGNRPDLILLRALLALVCCQLVGMIAGSLLGRLVAEQEARYREQNPVPVVPSSSAAPSNEVVEVGEAVDEPGATHARR
jgi:hypothetical protein